MKQPVVMTTPATANIIPIIYLLEYFDKLKLIPSSQMDWERDIATLEFGCDMGLKCQHFFRCHAITPKAFPNRHMIRFTSIGFIPRCRTRYDGPYQYGWI